MIVRPFVQPNERTDRLDAPAANTLLVWLRRRAEAIRHAALDKNVRRLAQKRGVSQSSVIAEAVEALLDTSISSTPPTFVGVIKGGPPPFSGRSTTWFTSDAWSRRAWPANHAGATVVIPIAETTAASRLS